MEKGLKTFFAFIGIILVFGVLFVIIGVLGSGRNSSQNNYSKQKVTEEKSVEEKEAEKANQLSKYIETVAKRDLDDKFIRLKINPDFSNEGKLIVLIYYKSSTSKISNFNIIFPVYHDIYKFSDSYMVSEVVMFGEAELVKPDGKKYTDTVMKTMMTKETSKKIQWNSFDWRYLGSYLDDIMTHPALPNG